MSPVDRPELASPLRRLRTGFPDVPADTVASILGDSYLSIVSVTGEPEVERAEELAVLRLEIRSGHPIGGVI